MHSGQMLFSPSPNYIVYTEENRANEKWKKGKKEHKQNEEMHGGYLLLSVLKFELTLCSV